MKGKFDKSRVICGSVIKGEKRKNTMRSVGALKQGATKAQACNCNSRITIISTIDNYIDKRI